MSYSFVKVMNSRRFGEGGNVAIMGEARVAYGILMGKLVENSLVKCAARSLKLFLLLCLESAACIQ
jgi:hypothetical protein